MHHSVIGVKENINPDQEVEQATPKNSEQTKKIEPSDNGQMTKWMEKAAFFIIMVIFIMDNLAKVKPMALVSSSQKLAQDLKENGKLI